MKIYLRALLMMCIMLFVLPALAADDAADNACYAGGSMAGKCELATEAETEWAWTCGWYIARAERAVIAPDSVPAWCGYANLTISHDGCYAAPSTSYRDFRIIGPFMTAGNATAYGSSDGTCTFPVSTITIIEASGTSDATDKCQALVSLAYFGYHLNSAGFSVPSNWYLCETIAK